jgi:hypothetical protein
MCKKQGETPDHLLLYCDTVKDLYNLVFKIFGVEWLCLDSGGATGVFKKRFSWNDFNVVLDVIPSCLMWYMWREMNARSFGDCERTSLDL